MEASMDIKLGHRTAGRKHIKVLLQRRDHLKKVALERLLQGKAVSFHFREMSAINSILNELLALRGYETISNVEDDPADEETERYAVEVDTLSAEEAAAMIPPRKSNPIQVREGKRIRFHPTAEVRIARTTSPRMDMVTITLWRSIDGMDEWRNMGGFKIPVEAFSAFVQELNAMNIDKLDSG